MKRLKQLLHDERGATMVEFGFAFPVFIVMIWMLIQLGFIFRANAGIQQALGEGARFATLCATPTILGCRVPEPEVVKLRMESPVDGTHLGTFTAELPVLRNLGGANFYDLRVYYTMRTSLLLFPGPTISISKTKRVWVAG